ncbi:hypothetical protein Gotri_006059 [Gossypium trilobum]|uniref:DUF4283 domain-containing protein n=1 Tax=Gossypium trilobum TaxID=34281 RepID=A0A7J9EZ29_9ROSI|nr:hypothetical protein [Gossypium trilobum]
MEDRMARLCISDGKEEEVMQFGGLSGGTNRLYDCCLVGTFLTASVVQFQAMRNMLANLWHPIAVHDLPPGFYFKAVAKQLGDFIGEFFEYDCNQLKWGTQPPSRAVVGESICLRNSQVQAFDLEMFNNMNRVLRVNFDGKTKVVFGSEWDSNEGRAQDLMIHDLEEISVGE